MSANAASRWGLRVLGLGYSVPAPAGAAGADLLQNLRRRDLAPPLDAITSPDGLHALKLTLIMVAIAVPLNTIFGVVCALLLVRHRCQRQRRDRRRDQPPLRDLTGRDRPLALPPLRDRRLARPGARRSRDQGPLLGPGHDPRQHLRLAARSWSGRRCRCCRRSAPSRSRPPRPSAPTRWQTFWRITLPAIRWGVAYGVVLTTARVLGEFGAVTIVSGTISRPDPDPAALRREAVRELQPPGRLRRLRRARPAGAGDPARDEPAANERRTPDGNLSRGSQQALR